jgi:hypothetical protein
VEVASASATALSLSLRLEPSTPPGAYVVAVRTEEGGGAAVLVVAPSSPTIASVAPATVSRPGTPEVVLSGTGLLRPDGSAGTVSVVTAERGQPVPFEVVSSEAGALRLRLTLPADLPVGDLLVGVSTEDGSAAAVVPVAPAPPSIASVSPARVGLPATADLVIAGENLLQPDGKPPRVAVTRVGSASAIRPLVVSSKPDSLTVRISTAVGTMPGPQVLSVRTADGVAAVLFEVVDAPAPSVTGIDVAQATPGATVLTIVRGTGLAGATDITFDGEGVNGTVLPGGNDRELHVKIAVALGAAKGSRTFSVSAPGGTAGSGKIVFHVR